MRYRAAGVPMLLALVAAVCLPVVPAAAQHLSQQYIDSLYREGFTTTLTLGLGFQGSMDEHVDFQTAFSGLNIGLGWFVHPTAALQLRYASTITRRDASGGFNAIDDFTTFHALVGPSVLLFLGRYLSLEFGAGMSFFLAEVREQDSVIGSVKVSQSDIGWGGLVGTSVPMVRIMDGRGAVVAGGEANVGFFDNLNMASISLVMGVRLY